jgi:septum formation protein
MKQIVLASASPRRAKILEALGVSFVVEKTEANEVSYAGEPERTVKENALAKGAAATFKGDVLSADTIVWYNDKIYGKPATQEEAKEFLRELSGRVHIVFTGVAFNGDVKVVKSEVKFRELTKKAIDEYVKKVNPLDRAGAYDIDESGELIVEEFSGSRENIMGLPVEPLKEWGICR